MKQASVMYDPTLASLMGSALLTMESLEEAEEAVMALNATDLMGKAIMVEKVHL